VATVTVQDVALEYEWWGNASERVPVLLLHEAMGSVKGWGEFPRLLADALGCRVYAYSRQGSGRSESLETDELAPDLLEHEALELLPALCQALHPAALLKNLSPRRGWGLLRTWPRRPARRPWTRKPPVR
jgi:hypothetical protein